MRSFSRTLIDLYEIAEDVSIDAFSREAIRVLRPLFRFDGAVFGFGESLESDKLELVINHAFVYERDEGILEDYGALSYQDPISRQFMAGLYQPLICTCRDFFRQAKLPSMEAFARRHDLQHLMLYGTAGGGAKPARWLAVYRGTDACFNKKDSDDLYALWPHVERCIEINRSRQLERQIRSREQRAAALVNQRGFIEAADPGFRDLMALEWPFASLAKMPDPVLACLRTGANFAGTRIRISLFAQDEYFVCKAFEKNLLSALTPAELAVAQQFSRGLTHKDVASILGVSQNTVRTHIKHVYDKLAIHDKARLAHLMATTFNR